MKKLWSFFSSTKLTVILAGIICVVAAAGSILAVYAPEFYRAMDKIILLPWMAERGLAYFKYTFWMYLLILLTAIFSINTVVCTVDKVYSIIATKKPVRSLYPHIVHVGFLIALIGHLTGSLWGFRTFGNALIAGSAIPVPNVPGLTMSLVDYELTQGPTGEVEDLKTQITLYKDKKEILTETLGINNPLIYEGIAFYHVDQGEAPTGLILNAGGNTITTGFEGTFSSRLNKSFKLGGVFPDFAIDRSGKAITRSEKFLNPHIEIISDNKRAYLDLTRPGTVVRLNSTDIAFVDLKMSKFVELRIHNDPGIGFIIAGSAILTIGMLLLLFLRGERGEIVSQRREEN